MSIEKQRARLIRKVIVLELVQDVMLLLVGVFGAVRDFFFNISSTAKILEVDAAKQYRDLVGTAVREVDNALIGVVPDEEDDD